MAQKIITAAEVLSAAFSDGAYIAPESISDSDILAAVERWIEPVTGRKLLEAVERGMYADFATSYLKPCVAAYVRLLIQPRLSAVTSQLGVSAPASASHRTADESLRRELMASLRSRAHALRRRMSEYLNNAPHSMAEYVAENNILNRCNCDGGFVQIL
jgi:hypothetical protein